MGNVILENNIAHELNELIVKIKHAISLLDKGEVKQASESYGELKRGLVNRESELAKRERLGESTEIEKYILIPAITEVLLHCKARVGTTNETLLSDTLVECEDYLEYHLSMINN